MKTVLGLALSCVGSTAAARFSSLPTRQVDGNVDASVYLRRGYHSTLVLDRWLYIDGGEVSYASGSGVTYQYADDLLALDLSKNWTNTSLPYTSIAKPNGVPDLTGGGLWVDEEEKTIYTGFAGTPSVFGDSAFQSKGLWSFVADGKGGGQWNNLNKTADSIFTDNSPRPYNGESVSIPGAGLFMGGFVGGVTGDDGNASTVAQLWNFDFKSKKVANVSATGSSTGTAVQYGRLIHVPNFGPEGIVVQLGGDNWGKDEPGFDSLISFNTVQIQDISTGSWYSQTTTGSQPEARKEFCVAGAASNNKTYEILVYAGWGGHLGTDAIPFDEAFVLTLPGFHWVKANYQALHPRHALSCEAVGGSQVVVVGGIDTTQVGPDSLYQGPFNTADRFVNGIAVFDLTTMAFASQYNANPPSYTQSRDLQFFYANNARQPNFDSSALAAVFKTQNFTSGDSSGSGSGGSQSGGSGNGTSPASGSSSAPSSTNVGAIAGGVVGGVAALALIGGAIVWFCCRRRRQDRSNLPAEVPGQDQFPPNANGQQQQTNGGYYSLPKQQEKYVEAPANETERYELGQYQAGWVAQSPSTQKNSMHEQSVASSPPPHSSLSGTTNGHSFASELPAEYNLPHGPSPVSR